MSRDAAVTLVKFMVVPFGMVIWITLVGLAFGITTITYSVPDAYAIRHFKAQKAQSGANVVITISRSTRGGGEPRLEYFADISFELPAYDPNIPNDVFVKRRNAMFADAQTLAHEKKLEQDAKKAYLAGAPSITVKVPDPNEMN